MNPFLPVNPPEDPEIISQTKKTIVVMEICPFGDEAFEKHEFTITGEFEDDDLTKITEIECDFFLKPVERIVRKSVFNHSEDLEWEAVQ